MRKFKMVILGCGQRGQYLYRDALKQRDYINFVALSDPYEEKMKLLAEQMVKDGRPEPKMYVDYKECIDKEKPDCVLVSTSWRAHYETAMYCLRAGVAVGCEIGGAYSEKQLWDLINCVEETKTPFMALENCCFGKLETLALNMKRLGLLGKVVYGECGYRHCLLEEITTGREKKHYRLDQYIHRNCDNYPTHGIGPMAKLMDINTGNRFVSIVSVANKPVGLKEYVKDKKIDSLKDVEFNQADVVTSIIKCANGETIRLTLDTCLPRYYSRDFAVQGTKGLINEQNQSVYLESDWPEEQWDWSKEYNNINRYFEKYGHPIWKDKVSSEGGHCDIDSIEFDVFFDCLDKGKEMPIDVYDYASWAIISKLSEESIATGLPVAFPDFTEGKWITRENKFLK